MERFLKAFREAKQNNHLLVYSRYAHDYCVLSHVKYILTDEIIIKQF